MELDYVTFVHPLPLENERGAQTAKQAAVEAAARRAAAAAATPAEVSAMTATRMTALLATLTALKPTDALTPNELLHTLKRIQQAHRSPTDSKPSTPEPDVSAPAYTNILMETMLAEARADYVPLTRVAVAAQLEERVLRLLRPVCASHLLTCSHAIELQELFADPDHKARAVVMCFGRVVDFGNWPRVMLALPPGAQVSTYKSVG